jgi:hypothetical protein
MCLGWGITMRWSQACLKHSNHLFIDPRAGSARSFWSMGLSMEFRSIKSNVVLEYVDKIG